MISKEENFMSPEELTKWTIDQAAINSAPEVLKILGVKPKKMSNIKDIIKKDK